MKGVIHCKCFARLKEFICGISPVESQFYAENLLLFCQILKEHYAILSTNLLRPFRFFLFCYRCVVLSIRFSYISTSIVFIFVLCQIFMPSWVIRWGHTVLSLSVYRSVCPPLCLYICLSVYICKISTVPVNTDLYKVHFSDFVSAFLGSDTFRCHQFGPFYVLDLDPVTQDDITSVMVFLTNTFCLYCILTE